jgi:hypothetical protein
MLTELWIEKVIAQVDIEKLIGKKNLATFQTTEIHSCGE